ncbi:unnamed protein product [Leptosia nina]|uniref:Uncharacterized protein n=1 Tax=Leptosia nina TaxID=320188 RepID=A0AAV1ITP8_9NEOP
MSKPRYVELDEDEHELFKHAFDTPSYHDDCDDAEDLKIGKLDLVNDGMWALKAKVKELKAFNKALMANLVTTKLKVKELFSNMLEKKQKLEFMKKDKPIKYQILPVILVETQPLSYNDQNIAAAQVIPKHDSNSEQGEQIISVRITSSVAVERGVKTKPNNGAIDIVAITTHEPFTTLADVTGAFTTATNYDLGTNTFQTTENVRESITELPPHLAGANIEYIKQLQAKKESRTLFSDADKYATSQSENHLNDTIQSESNTRFQKDLTVKHGDKNEHFIGDIPIARSIPLSYSSKSYIQRDPSYNNQKLTTVSFNVVHDSSKLSYNQQSAYTAPNQSQQKYYNAPPKIYSEPAQIYSEPAKFYSEPARVYSEPSKIYSEPAKVYSEPAKIYSEPAKFYSEPASLHLTSDHDLTSRNPWIQRTDTTAHTYSTTPSNGVTNPYTNDRPVEHQPEKNYEIDEKVSVMTDGRSHGEQPNNPENCKQENCKVGYVVEGRQFRKYRVEERTSDGFIVGEYGVVRNEDGALRGVRYTADSEASPRLIHDALMKFLQLK